METDDDLEEVVAVTEPEDVHYEGEGFRVDFVIQSSWENHYNAVITVTNTSDETLHNWGLSFVMMLPEGDRGSSWSIFQIENGTFRVLNIVEEELMIHRE